MAGQIGITLSVQERVKGTPPDVVQVAVDTLRSAKLYVGIPEGSGGNGRLNNVQLAYLHSHGSPVNNIPARPFIEPAIEQDEVLSNIAEQFGFAFDAAIMGDIGGVQAALQRAGMYGANAVQAYMGSGALAPNAPITVSGGWMANKVSGKPFRVKGKGSDAPLIDTGSLRSSVTYVLEMGGA